MVYNPFYLYDTINKAKFLKKFCFCLINLNFILILIIVVVLNLRINVFM